MQSTGKQLTLKVISMKLINMKNLYKAILNNDGGTLKEYSKSMDPEEVKNLRLNSALAFKVIKLISYFINKGKEHNLGSTVTTPPHYFHTASKQEYKEHFNSIVNSIPTWNALTLDGDTHSYFITLDKKKEKYDGFEDALQWSCYTAKALKLYLRIHIDDSIYKTYYKLLKGIDKCLIVDKNNKHYAIIRHPLQSVHKDLEPISQDMLSGLVQVIAGFTYTDSEIGSLELQIRRKFSTIMSYHDYCLMYPDGTTNSYDLHPSLIYNHIKSFAYSSIRLAQGSYNANDAKILKEMLQILLYENKPPYDRSWYGLVVAVNFLEAIMQLYPQVGVEPEVDKVMNKFDVLHLIVVWLKHYRRATPEIHPELESVLFTAYDILGHKDGKKETSANVLKVLGNYIKFNIITKTRDNHKIVPSYNRKYALTPGFRKPADYYWQRSAWLTEVDNEVHPSFDYLLPYSRILPFISY